MPLYEYECDTCGHRFEVIQKFSDAPHTTCPKCGGAVRKLLSSPAIQFKGSVWYITDYARKNTAGSGTTKEGAGDKDKPAASSSETPAKSDAPAKPAASTKP